MATVSTKNSQGKVKAVALTVLVNVCRFLLGATFVFSGFVKASDQALFGFQPAPQAHILSRWPKSCLIRKFGGARHRTTVLLLKNQTL